MTTTVEIINKGQQEAKIMYYNQARQFKQEVDVLKPNESITINVWDGNLPVIMAPVYEAVEAKDGAEFYSVPPATY